METNIRTNKRNRPQSVQPVKSEELVFNLKDIVYLKTDTGQYPRMIIAITYNLNGVLYQLASGTEVSSHYKEELSKEKDILISTSYI